MKQTLLALLVIVAPAWAGKRIQMESTDLKSNKTTAQVVMVDADRLKVDTGDNAFMFLSKGGNRVVMLDKKRNEYMVMDQAMMDQMAQQMAGVSSQLEAALKNIPPAQRAQMEAMLKGKMGATQVAAPVNTIYAAKGAGTVNGFKCTNYDGSQNGQKVTEICAASMSDVKLSASDFQVMEKMREYMAGLQKAMQNSPIGGMVVDSGLTQPGVNGFPVQTTTIRNGQAVSRNEVKSVTEAAFTEADFSTGNAKQREMPGMGKR